MLSAPCLSTSCTDFRWLFNRSLSIKSADVLFGTIGSTVRVAGGFSKRQGRVSDCNWGLRSSSKGLERKKWCLLLMYVAMGRRKPWRLWHFAHLISGRDGVSWRTRITNWKLLLSALENETNAQSTCSGWEVSQVLMFFTAVTVVCNFHPFRRDSTEIAFVSLSEERLCLWGASAAFVPPLVDWLGWRGPAVSVFIERDYNTQIEQVWCFTCQFKRLLGRSILSWVKRW